MHAAAELCERTLVLTAYLSYRALVGRRDELRLPLRADEEERLAELSRVFAPPPGEPPGASLFLPRLEHRQPIALPVAFRTDGGDVHDGVLGALSIDGFFVESAHQAAPGERVAFRFLDERAGREWHFSGVVEGALAPVSIGMRLRFVGVPIELRHGHFAAITELGAVA